MTTFFCSSFSKDLSKIDNPVILDQVRTLINLIENLDTVRSIPGIRKLKGSKCAYRIRLGDYRVGMLKIKEGIAFSRILHRRDIYKYFPQ
jgi:mRNA interferase RelE/StbE